MTISNLLNLLMTPFEQLVTAFERFPGVGLRQARRFAFYTLNLQANDAKHLADLITSLSASVSVCSSCRRYFSPTAYGDQDRCSICSDVNRQLDQLLVVAFDGDIQAIEKSKVYEGLYFVLGGTVPLLNSKENDTKLRGSSLKKLIAIRLQEVEKLEVILGFAVNPDGENTGRYVEALLKDWVTEDKIKISYLGRGLSTGSELEYADAETIKNALRGRG